MFGVYHIFHPKILSDLKDIGKSMPFLLKSSQEILYTKWRVTIRKAYPFDKSELIIQNIPNTKH